MTYKARIYKITCLHCGKLYIGHTKNALSKRMAGHRDKSKTSNCKLYKHMREVGKDLFVISLIEEKEFKSRDEARNAENNQIFLLKTVTEGLNGRSEMRDIDNEKRIKREYYERNVEELKAKKKAIYKANPQKFISDEQERRIRNSQNHRYVCEVCDYVASDTYKLNRHYHGLKHIKNTFKSLPFGSE